MVDLVQEPSSLDPHLQWNPDSYFVYRNVFDNMVTRDDEGKIVPQVATAWKQVDDTTIEFTLRSDIKFHDGTPLTAEDVAFSVKRITDPAVQEPAARPVQQDRRRHGGQPDDRAAEDRRRLSGAAGAAGQALDRAEGPCREDRQREVQSGADGLGPLQVRLDPARREDDARAQRRLLGTQRAVRHRRVPRGSGPGNARRQPSLRQVRPDRDDQRRPRAGAEEGRQGEGAQRAERARRLLPPQFPHRPDREPEGPPGHRARDRQAGHHRRPDARLRQAGRDHALARPCRLRRRLQGGVPLRPREGQGPAEGGRRHAGHRASRCSPRRPSTSASCRRSSRC